MLRKLLWLSMSMAGIFAIAATTYLTLAVFTGPYAKPLLSNISSSTGNTDKTRVLAGTVVREEYEYLCGDVHIVYLGRAPDKLVGLTHANLKQKYPAKDGWTVENTEETVVLKKRCNEFCPEHKNYRHLGICEGLLAVYEGPLGYDKKLLKTEKNMLIERMPADYQTKLHQAMAFEKQLPETQFQLRKELEFTSESSLQAAMENLDELLTDFN